MPKLVAGAKRETDAQPRKPVIDVARHRDGLADAAAQVRALVARLEQGRTVLGTMAKDDDRRGEAGRLWSELCVRTHEAMRNAYARFALLRIALGNEAALVVWDELMPTADTLADIGITQMIAYWRGRTDPVEWMTHQEAQFVTRALWPPNGTDPIDRGLLDLIEPAPF